jgi:hypothetical protein
MRLNNSAGLADASPPSDSPPEGRPCRAKACVLRSGGEVRPLLSGVVL